MKIDRNTKHPDGVGSRADAAETAADAETRGRMQATPQDAIWTIVSIGGSVALFGGVADASPEQDGSEHIGAQPAEDEGLRAPANTDRDAPREPQPALDPGAPATTAKSSKKQTPAQADDTASAPLPADDAVFADAPPPAPEAYTAAAAQHHHGANGAFVQGGAAAATTANGPAGAGYLDLDLGGLGFGANYGQLGALGLFDRPSYTNVQSVIDALEGRLESLGALNPSSIGPLSSHDLDFESILGVSLDELFDSLMPTDFTHDFATAANSALQQTYLEMTDMPTGIGNFSLLGPSISIFNDLVPEDGAPLQATVGGGSAALGLNAYANGFAGTLGYQTPSADLISGQATFVAEGEDVTSTSGADVSGADVVIVYQHNQDFGVLGQQQQTVSTTAIHAVNYPGFDFANGPIIAVRSVGGDFNSQYLIRTLNPGLDFTRGDADVDIGTNATAQFDSTFYDDYDFGDILTTGGALTQTDPGAAVATANAGIGIDVF
ncbi:MAG: hypothetical protein AAGF51_04965 [Pseudomonadota bacterium]